MIHDFRESLEKSNRYQDAHWWLEVYREAFPDLQACVNVRSDGWAQRGGIDRVLTLESGRTLTVDEKIRDKDWPDILLEYWSDKDRKVRGWVAKDLACDFIAYAFVPSATCYLIPFQTLRRAWRRNGREWVDRHKVVDAQNNGYVTRSVAVPLDIFLQSLTESMVVTWEKENV